MQMARPLFGPAFVAQCILLALPFFVAAPALAQSIVEKRLASLQPCGNLRTEQKLAGVPIVIGIDKLKSIAMRRAELAISGDEVTVSFAGGIACRTSDGAVIKGDAAVDLTASAVVNLADCSIGSLSITPTRFGGSFSKILEGAWEPVIRPKLEADAITMLKQACADFVTGR